jgi:hypothetical protein
MAAYFAMRIEGGYLEYTAVVTKHPQYKSDIDAILIADGYQNLIV